MTRQNIIHIKSHSKQDYQNFKSNGLVITKLSQIVVQRNYEKIKL